MASSPVDRGLSDGGTRKSVGISIFFEHLTRLKCGDEKMRLFFSGVLIGGWFFG